MSLRLPSVYPSPHRLVSRRAPLWSGIGLGLVTLLASCNTGTASPPSQEESKQPTSTETWSFDAARAWKDLEKLVSFGPRPAGSAELEQCRRFLETSLKEIGLEPRRESFQVLDTPIGPVNFCNLIADFPGAPGQDGEESPIVYLGSHYDTKLIQGVRFVGANDGGSSTAALLELARAIVGSGPRPVTYRFIFFDGEEPFREFWADPDNTYGSRHHAQALSRSEEFERVKALILLDMVGDAHLRLWRDTYSSRNLLGLFLETAKREGLAEYFTGAAQPVKDDHIPFLDIGIPAIDLIDLDFGPNSRTNQWWHTPEDTLDKCSPESLQIVGRLVLAALPTLERVVTQ